MCTTCKFDEIAADYRAKVRKNAEICFSCKDRMRRAGLKPLRFHLKVMFFVYYESTNMRVFYI